MWGALVGGFLLGGSSAWKAHVVQQSLGETEAETSKMIDDLIQFGEIEEAVGYAATASVRALASGATAHREEGDAAMNRARVLVGRYGGWQDDLSEEMTGPPVAPALDALGQALRASYKAGPPGSAEDIAERLDALPDTTAEFRRVVGRHRVKLQAHVANNRATATQLRRVQQRLFVASFAIGALLTVVYSGLMLRGILGPVRRLTEGARRLAAGDWEHRLRITSGDEFEEAGAVFDSMAHKLGEAYRNLEVEVELRTAALRRQLEAQTTLLELSADLSSAVDMSGSLDRVAQAIGTAVRCSFARVALIPSEHPVPVIRAAWPMRRLDWEPGLGMVLTRDIAPTVHAALEARRPILIDGAPEDESARTERALLLTAHSHTGLVLPLHHAGRALGAIILGEERTPDRDRFDHDRTVLAQTITNQVAIAVASTQNWLELQETLLGSVTAMGSAIDAKSHWTRGHSERVMQISVVLGHRFGLDEDDLHTLRVGALLHDIGKIGVAGRLLDKPGRLEADERLEVERHPAIGESILTPVRPLARVLPILRNHHERWDGKGYPDSLAGESIPLFARICAVADAWDAMTSDRPYRAAMDRTRAIEEVRRGGGIQLDPQLAALLCDLVDRGDV